MVLGVVPNPRLNPTGVDEEAEGIVAMVVVAPPNPNADWGCGAAAVKPVWDCGTAAVNPVCGGGAVAVNPVWGWETVAVKDVVPVPKEKPKLVMTL